MLWSVCQVWSYSRLLSGSYYHFGAGVFPSQLRDQPPFQGGRGELQIFTTSNPFPLRTTISCVNCSVDVVE